MAEARKSLMTSSFELFFCWMLVAHKSCIICRLATYLLASHSHLVSERTTADEIGCFLTTFSSSECCGSDNWKLDEPEAGVPRGFHLWRGEGHLVQTFGGEMKKYLLLLLVFLHSRIQSVRSPTYSLHLWWYLLITFSNSNNRAHKIYAAIKQLK